MALSSQTLTCQGNTNVSQLMYIESPYIQQSLGNRQARCCMHHTRQLGFLLMRCQSVVVLYIYEHTKWMI